MAFTLADRVRETSTTTGTGAYALAGAVTGFRTFSSGIGANQTSYVATMGGQWEVGIGTVSGSSLARTSILASSNLGSAVNWAVGTKDIRCDLPASVAMELYEGVPRWGTLSGLISTVACTVTPPIYSYFPGLTIRAIAHASLDNVDMTLNVSGLGPKEVRGVDNADFAWNAMGNGFLLTFVYDGTRFRVFPYKGA